MNEWDERMIATYAGEVEWQCYFAILAADRYNECMVRYLQKDFGVREHLEAYSSAQGILTAAAAISKLLWVSMPKDAPADSGMTQEEYSERRSFSLRRASALRSALEVSGNSILQSRQVRNAVEHYDERLDSFYMFKDGPLMDANIGPLKRMTNLPRENILRHLDPDTGEVSVLDKAIRLQDLLAAIDEIGTRAKALKEQSRFA